MRHTLPMRPLRLIATTALWLAATLPAQALDYAASIWATGLNSPSGLAFSPDGALWIAETGTPGGGGPSTIVRGQTLTYNETGSLSRVHLGVQSRVVTGLPAIYVAATGQMDAGVRAIDFDAAGGRSLLFGLGVNPQLRFTDLAPVGAQLGLLHRPGVPSVDVAAHEAAVNPGGGALDSNPFKMARQGDGVLVVDAAANALLRVAPDGTIATAATFSARDLGGPRPTEAVPTGVAIGPDGLAYVTEMTGFPFVSGTSRVMRVAADGTTSIHAEGFTMAIDIAFDAQGRMLVLEYDSNGLLQPGNQGRLWQVDATGHRTLVWADGLDHPTDLLIGPDGAFYVTTRTDSAGLGQVLRIAAVPEPGTYALLIIGLAMTGWMARRR